MIVVTAFTKKEIVFEKTEMMFVMQSEDEENALGIPYITLNMNTNVCLFMISQTSMRD